MHKWHNFLFYSSLSWRHYWATVLHQKPLGGVSSQQLWTCRLPTNAYDRVWLDQLLGRGLQDIQSIRPRVSPRWGRRGPLLPSRVREMVRLPRKLMLKENLSGIPHYCKWICNTGQVAPVLGWGLQDLCQGQGKLCSYQLIWWYFAVLCVREKLGGSGTWEYRQEDLSGEHTPTCLLDLWWLCLGNTSHLEKRVATNKKTDHRTLFLITV